MKNAEMHVKIKDKNTTFHHIKHNHFRSQPKSQMHLYVAMINAKFCNHTWKSPDYISETTTSIFKIHTLHKLCN